MERSEFPRQTTINIGVVSITKMRLPLPMLELQQFL